MIYKEVVCHVPCKQTECKHHRCHLPKHGVDYMNELEYDVENFPKNGNCPYEKKWIKGKGLAE